MEEDQGLRGISVLVVDDVEDNLDLIEELLEDEVWSILRAQSGEEAVSLAVKCRPDLILLDMMMPRMSGLAVLRAIRSNEALGNVAVIFQTAYADKENIITARRMGCESFLCKPLTKDRLLAEMDKCLKARPPGGTGDCEPSGDSALSQNVMELTMTLADAKAMLETNRSTDDSRQAEPVDCFRNLIPDDSATGARLIRLANSPVYGARYPARTVAEAVVRIGIHETKTLIEKASSETTKGIATGNVIKALELLEVLAALFPDRTSTPDGTLSLLEELNAAAQSKQTNAKKQEP